MSLDEFSWLRGGQCGTRVLSLRRLPGGVYRVTDERGRTCAWTFGQKRALRFVDAVGDTLTGARRKVDTAPHAPLPAQTATPPGSVDEGGDVRGWMHLLDCGCARRYSLRVGAGGLAYCSTHARSARVKVDPAPVYARPWATRLTARPGGGVAMGTVSSGSSVCVDCTPPCRVCGGAS